MKFYSILRYRFSRLRFLVRKKITPKFKSSVRKGVLYLFVVFLMVSGFMPLFSIPKASALTPTVVQECEHTGQSTNTISCTMSSSVTTGNVLVCGAFVGSASTQATVNDTLDTVFKPRNSITRVVGGNNFVAFQWTGTLTVSGAEAINININGTGTAEMDCLEVTNVYESVIGVDVSFGTTTSGATYNLALSPPYTPIVGNFVYVYALADACGGNAGFTYDSSYTALNAHNAVAVTGTACKVAPPTNFKAGQTAMYSVWPSGSTTASITWLQGTAIGEGTGSWAELLLELSSTPPPPIPPTTTQTTTVPFNPSIGSAVFDRSASYGNLQKSYYTLGVQQANLNMLYSTGAGCIRVDINYAPWLNGNTTQQNEMTTIVNNIKSTGHCLIIADAASESYRGHGAIPWAQFKLAWAARVRFLAALYTPNYYEVIKEPGWYCRMISDCFNNALVQNYTEWVNLGANLTGTVLLVSPTTKVGLAISASGLTNAAPEYINLMLGWSHISQVNFLGFDIYTALNQQSTAAYINGYGLNGKAFWIPEWWSTTGGGDSGNDPLAMTNIYTFAGQYNAAFFIPFFTNDFASYSLSSMTNTTQIINTYNTQRTPVFYTYQSLIAIKPVPPVVATVCLSFSNLNSSVIILPIVITVAIASFLILILLALGQNEGDNNDILLPIVGLISIAIVVGISVVVIVYGLGVESSTVACLILGRT